MRREWRTEPFSRSHEAAPCATDDGDDGDEHPRASVSLSSTSSVVSSLAAQALPSRVEIQFQPGQQADWPFEAG